MENNLDAIYKLRNDFLVIGLTGRLGSGCSTIAKILSEDSFSNNLFPIPMARDFQHNEERKYKIVYNFLKQNWKNFMVIRPSEIITYYLLKQEIAKVKAFLCKEYENKKSEIEAIFKESSTEWDRLSNLIKQLEGKLKKELIDLTTNDISADLVSEIYAIFFENKEVKSFYDKLRTAFLQLKDEKKPAPFQLFGDNLRRCGNPISESDCDFNPESCYKISKTINVLIKVIKAKNKSSSISTRIVIDSIRNSMEALYFKERYSAFYLFAVNTEDNDRVSRLSEYTPKEIKALDNEYKDIKPKEKFYHQDIKTCIQNADIYLYNPNDSNREEIKKQLVRYISLILHPGIITPSSPERCMQIAYTAKYNSGCISRQVGAVVTDISYSMKSIGWNNTAQGQTPCLLRNVDDLKHNTDSESFSDYEKSDEFKKIIIQTFDKDNSQKLRGRNLSFCFKECQNCKDGEKNQVHTRSLHAEENAMLQISKYGGEGLKDGILFTTASPCELCSKKAYQLGIKKVYYIDPYPGIAQNQILKIGKANNRPELSLFIGAIGRAYHQLYQPFMAYKDELNILLNYDYNKNIEKDSKTELNPDEIAKKLLVKGLTIDEVHEITNIDKFKLGKM